MKKITFGLLFVFLLCCHNNLLAFELPEPLAAFFEVDLERDNDVIDIIYSLDNEKINNFIHATIRENSISNDIVNSLDIFTNQENLYLIGIYGYFYNEEWHLISEEALTNASIMYFLTIEIGDGVLPIANINGNVSLELYRRSIMIDNRIIGTVRVWDVRNISGGNFVFINFDKNMNIFYTHIHQNISAFKEK